MKGLNLNKITTLILLVLWLFVMWKTLLKQPTKITIPTFEPKNEGISSLQEPIGQLDDAKHYSAILARFKAPFDVTRYQALLTRNIFIKPEKPVIIFSPESLRPISLRKAISLKIIK